MISVFPVQFPPSNTPVVDEKGAMNNSGMAFFRALYNRTGQGNGLVNQVNLSLATGQDITADWNLIGSGVGNSTLPALTDGQMVLVQNDTGFAINILPPTAAATIDGAPSYSLAPAKMQIFWFFSSTIIKSTQLG